MSEREERRESSPLAGMLVLEFGSAILGPYTSQQLAEYGARVIKVEPFEGDVTRQMGPSREAGMNSLFLANNRGKESIALDLKKPESREILARLAGRSDVLIHNMRAKSAVQLGLGHEALLASNPRLVVAVLTGFQAGGPYSDDAAYDDVIQALSGLAGLAAAAGDEPAYLPSAIADKTTSNIATQAILAALFRRERTGKGALVEVPMFETMASYVMLEHLGGFHFEPPAGPIGYTRYLAKSHRPVRTADGFVSVRPLTDAHWKGFFTGVGDDEALEDERFRTLEQRALHVDEIFARLESHTQVRTTSDCLELMRRLNVPAARVNRLTEVVTDPHLQAVGHFETIEDKAMGALRFAPLGPRIDGHRARLGVPPRLGEHTASVLRAIDFAEDEIESLVGAGVVRSFEG